MIDHVKNYLNPREPGYRMRIMRLLQAENPLLQKEKNMSKETEGEKEKRAEDYVKAVLEGINRVGSAAKYFGDDGFVLTLEKKLAKRNAENTQLKSDMKHLENKVKGVEAENTRLVERLDHYKEWVEARAEQINARDVLIDGLKNENDALKDRTALLEQEAKVIDPPPHKAFEIVDRGRGKCICPTQPRPIECGLNSEGHNVCRTCGWVVDSSKPKLNRYKVILPHGEQDIIAADSFILADCSTFHFFKGDELVAQAIGALAVIKE